MRFGLSLSLLGVLLADVCSGQVSFEWGAGFGRPGLRTKVVECEMHDFGLGPELCAATDDSTQSQIFRLHPELGWKALGTPLDEHVLDLQSFDAGSGPELYACRYLNAFPPNEPGLIFRWTGTQWSPVGTEFLGGNGIEAMGVHDFGQGPRLITAANSGGNFGLWAWNGSVWSFIPASTPPWGGVTELKVLDDGTGPALYAGGYAGIAKWLGASWQTIATTNGSVFALAAFDDGGGVKLYAGGSFSTIDGVPVSGIARRTGAAWGPLAGGSLTLISPPGSPVVKEIAVTQSPARLWVSGQFTGAGATAIGPLVSWDGAAWSSGASSWGTTESSLIVDGLVVSGTAGSETVFAGGTMTMVSGVPIGYVGSRPAATATWTNVPHSNGVHDGGIDALVVGDLGDGVKLYAGGTFTAIGGVSANKVARFDGTSWEALGSGITNGNQVNSLAIWNDGTGPALYAGGQFTHAGGVPCNYVAKWNGSAWSSLGSGLSTPFTGPIVRALIPVQLPAPALLVGGAFNYAGGQQVAGIASWRGTFWETVGNADLGVCITLAVFDFGTGPKIYGGGSGGSFGGVTGTGTGLQRYDGIAWTPVPGWNPVPMTTVVRSMEIHDDGAGAALYVAGNGPAPNPNAPSLAKIGAAGLVAVPGGDLQNGTVLGMRSFNDGAGPALYLGGPFLSLAGVPSPGIVRYKNGVLEGVGGGFSTDLPPVNNPPYVRPMAVFDDGSGPALFIGGTFERAGTIPSCGIAKWGAGAPVLAITQPAPGADATITCTNLQPGREYFTVPSLEICGGGPGSGPWLGLCASDPATLLAVTTIPVGVSPFHFISSGIVEVFGPYPVPGGIAVEAITVDVTGGQVWRVSPVASVTFQ